nr:uncharacterized protein CI109_001574 [Kwoniella shandongensis]KAA5530168.1 hypothetical protein CI109_001574 [Kwoniella shandongensis]
MSLSNSGFTKSIDHSIKSAYTVMPNNLHLNQLDSADDNTKLSWMRSTPSTTTWPGYNAQPQPAMPWWQQVHADFLPFELNQPIWQSEYSTPSRLLQPTFMSTPSFPVTFPDPGPPHAWKEQTGDGLLNSLTSMNYSLPQELYPLSQDTLNISTWQPNHNYPRILSPKSPSRLLSNQEELHVNHNDSMENPNTSTFLPHSVQGGVNSSLDFTGQQPGIQVGSDIHMKVPAKLSNKKISILADDDLIVTSGASQSGASCEAQSALDVENQKCLPQLVSSDLKASTFLIDFGDPGTPYSTFGAIPDDKTDSPEVPCVPSSQQQSSTCSGSNDAVIQIRSAPLVASKLSEKGKGEITEELGDKLFM